MSGTTPAESSGPGRLSRPAKRSDAVASYRVVDFLRGPSTNRGMQSPMSGRPSNLFRARRRGHPTGTRPQNTVALQECQGTAVGTTVETPVLAISIILQDSRPSTLARGIRLWPWPRPWPPGAIHPNGDSIHDTRYILATGGAPLEQADAHGVAPAVDVQDSVALGAQLTSQLVACPTGPGQSGRRDGPLAVTRHFRVVWFHPLAFRVFLAVGERRRSGWRRP